MKNIILYTKPIIANRRLHHSKGVSFTTKLWKDTKYALTLEMRSQWHTAPHSTPLVVTLRLYFGDKRKRDIDAYLKILLDAGEGVLYENDNQIAELHVYRFFDINNPRTEIDINEII